LLAQYHSCNFSLDLKFQQINLSSERVAALASLLMGWWHKVLIFPHPYKPSDNRVAALDELSVST